VSAVINRLNKKRSEKVTGSGSGKIMLPPNWESLSRAGDLADKIREVNPDKNVSTVVEMLRRKDEKGVKVPHHVKAKCGEKPHVLPRNWDKLSKQELSRKLRAKVLKPNSRKFTELFSKLESKKESRPAKEHIVKSDVIKLPTGWETFSQAELLEKLRSSQDVSQAKLSRLEANMNKTRIPANSVPRVATSHNKQLTANNVRLPADWDSTRPADLVEKIKAANPDRKLPDALLDNLMRRGQRCQEKVMTTHIKLPSNWSEISSAELAKTIIKENLCSADKRRLLDNLQIPKLDSFSKSRKQKQGQRSAGHKPYSVSSRKQKN